MTDTKRKEPVGACPAVQSKEKEDVNKCTCCSKDIYDRRAKYGLFTLASWSATDQEWSNWQKEIRIVRAFTCSKQKSNLKLLTLCIYFRYTITNKVYKIELSGIQTLFSELFPGNSERLGKRAFFAAMPPGPNNCERQLERVYINKQNANIKIDHVLRVRIVLDRLPYELAEKYLHNEQYSFADRGIGTLRPKVKICEHTQCQNIRQSLGMTDIEKVLLKMERLKFSVIVDPDPFFRMPFEHAHSALSYLCTLVAVIDSCPILQTRK